MPQQFTAQYFQQSGQVAGLGINVLSTSVSTATLTDNDLIRGDDAVESLAAPNGFRLFDGLQQVDFTLGQIVTVDDGEAVTTVTFSDGTTLAGVRALYDSQTGAYGYIAQQFLLDPAALAAAGKTLADISSVRVDALVDHDLSWADFGFTPNGVTVPDPQPEPEPEPEPVLTLLQGTAGADRLSGTAADELIRGGNGDDRLTGGAGEIPLSLVPTRATATVTATSSPTSTRPMTRSCSKPVPRSALSKSVMATSSSSWKATGT